MHSGWNDVTGSFLLQTARPFVATVRANDWGDAFCDYHLTRAESPFAVAGLRKCFAFTCPVLTQKKKVAGGSWNLQVLIGDRVERATLHVVNQTRGAFVGHAFGSWRGVERVWALRGCQKVSVSCS